MTKKAEFNAEEWSTVVEAPLYAAMHVISADRGGTLRETLALSRVYKEARAGHSASELLDELIKSPPSIDPDEVKAAGGDVGSVAAGRLREAMKILETKATPEERDAYKHFVMTA